ncbi:hypothetical protein ACWKSP_22180 [Micromonosporaceae bacterium Da 78-11]
MASEISEAVAAMIVARAAERELAWAKRRAAKVAFRAERKTARDHGLVARYARKTALSKPNPSIT